MPFGGRHKMENNVADRNILSHIVDEYGSNEFEELKTKFEVKRRKITIVQKKNL